VLFAQNLTKYRLFLEGSLDCKEVCWEDYLQESYWLTQKAKNTWSQQREKNLEFEAI
jgi:hypothetical protein